MTDVKWGKTTCSVCKKEKAANPKALETRIKKFGSMEAIAEKWVCRECAALTKGKTPKLQKEETSRPYTKERQLNKKEKKITTAESNKEQAEKEIEDFFAR